MGAGASVSEPPALFVSRDKVVESTLDTVHKLANIFTKGDYQVKYPRNVLWTLWYFLDDLHDKYSSGKDMWLILAPGDSPSKLVGVVQAIGGDFGIDPRRVQLLPFVMSGVGRTPEDEAVLRGYIYQAAKNMQLDAGKAAPVRIGTLDAVSSGSTVRWVWEQARVVNTQHPNLVSLELDPELRKPNVIENVIDMGSVFDIAEDSKSRCMPHESRVRMPRPQEIGDRCRDVVLMFSALLLLKYRPTVPKGMTQKLASKIISRAEESRKVVTVGQLSAAIAFFQTLEGGADDETRELQRALDLLPDFED